MTTRLQTVPSVRIPIYCILPPHIVANLARNGSQDFCHFSGEDRSVFFQKKLSRTVSLSRQSLCV